MYDDPVCDMCGAEAVLDSTQGHVVCTYCGNVMSEWNCSDNTHDARERSSVAFDRSTCSKAVGRVKGRVASFVAHHGLGATVSTLACQMVESVAHSTVKDTELVAWAFIALASEHLQSCRPMHDLAQVASVSTGKLIAACEPFRVQLSEAIGERDPLLDTVGETLVALQSLLTVLYSPSEKSEKLAARRNVRRRAEAASRNAGFTNIRPQTRARVLLLLFLRETGVEVPASVRKELKLGSGGVRGGLRKLTEPAPTA